MNIKIDRFITLFFRPVQIVVFITLLTLTSCFMFPPAGEEDETPLYFETNVNGRGLSMEIEFIKGKSHYFPLMAIWIEDTVGNYIQTLYVAQSISTGVFGHGDASMGKWMPGEIRRPAALPYWGHQRGVSSEDGLFLPSPENPVADAYTGATPSGSFILSTKSDTALEDPFMVFFEINQSWDWNGHWTNNKFPGDMEYRSSAQPALVYGTLVNPSGGQKEFVMKPVGRSHHSGATGNLYDDIHTLTTALHIAEKITVIFD